jgi:glycosyltransferase involved in cell wall biosynthesis
MAVERGLRVLLVPSAYYPHTGGIEELTRRLALALRRRGHAAMIVTNRWPGRPAAREVLDGVDVRRLAFELPASRPAHAARFALIAPRSALVLLRVAAAFRADVVHVNGAGPNAAYVAALRRLLRAPVVFSAHGEFRNDAHAALQRSRPLRWGLASLLRHAAAVTAPSAAVLEELREELDVRAPATVIPNAVEPAEFDGPAPAQDPAGPYLFTACRLVEQKGIDVLLRAFAQARESLGGRRLVIAGEGPERERLGRLAAELGLAREVAFTGAVGRRRLAELMRGADAFAFPSRQEAFGIALLEAMAAGTPAVASAVGGIPEFARDGENALLVPPDDPQRLAAALSRLAAEPALRARLAEGGRAQAARHAWSRTVPRYEELYARAARG